MHIAGIYLREENEYVGPFHSLDDARRFLELMQAFGEDLTGIEIVEFSDSGVSPSQIVTLPERRDLLARTAKRRGNHQKHPPKGEASPRRRGEKRKPKRSN